MKMRPFRLNIGSCQMIQEYGGEPLSGVGGDFCVEGLPALLAFLKRHGEADMHRLGDLI